jgi:hypothetical protein
MYYSAKELIERMKQLESFKSIPQGFHIIGIRSHADIPDSFDDVFNLMDGEKLVLSTTGTTNPGVTVLKNHQQYNPNGAAILKSDCIYPGVWKFGKHKGKMDALLQTGGEVLVYRDGDKDSKSEEIGVLQKGYFGINFHADQYDLNATDKNSNVVGGWSAGCQVCNNISDYKQFISACRNQKSVTYTLLNEFSV